MPWPTLGGETRGKREEKQPGGASFHLNGQSYKGGNRQGPAMWYNNGERGFHPEVFWVVYERSARRATVNHRPASQEAGLHISDRQWSRRRFVFKARIAIED